MHASQRGMCLQRESQSLIKLVIECSGRYVNRRFQFDSIWISSIHYESPFLLFSSSIADGLITRPQSNVLKRMAVPQRYNRTPVFQWRYSHCRRWRTANAVLIELSSIRTANRDKIALRYRIRWCSLPCVTAMPSINGIEFVFHEY